MNNEPNFTKVYLEDYAGRLKMFYDALIDEGFDRDQALNLTGICLQTGLAMSMGGEQ